MAKTDVFWEQRRPSLYIVRTLVLADDVSAVSLSNYFSYERLGRVTSSDSPLAVLTAEAALPFSVVPHLEIDVNARDIQDYESVAEFKRRWWNFFEDKLAQADPNFPDVIVTHEANIACTTKGIPVMPGGLIATYGNDKDFKLEPKIGAVLEDLDAGIE
jgi:hypothetical protein